MIKLKKLEKPRIATEIPPYEPPVMRHRASIMPEKMLGERLLEQFEKLEAEELQKVKEIAKMARMTTRPKVRSKPKKYHIILTVTEGYCYHLKFQHL